MSSAALFLLERPMHEHYPEATLNFWSYAGGSAVTLVVGVVVFGVRPVDFLLTGRREPWIAIMFGVLFVSAYTPKAYRWVLRVVRPFTAIKYLAQQPATAAIVSIAILDTHVTVHENLGGQVVGIGTMVAVYAKRLDRRRGSNRPQATQAGYSGNGDDVT